MKKVGKEMKSKSVILLVALLLLYGACAKVSPVAPSSTSKPARIISLTPSTTEILYGVGAFDRVVAVSDYCTYPPDVKKLPRVGGWNNPNMEQIAALRPDLVASTDYLAPIFDNRTFTSRAYRFDGVRKGDLTASYTLPLSESRRLRFFGKVENVFDRDYYENGFRTPGANARAGAALHF